MRNMLILQCSPRAGGVSDTVAEIFAAGALRGGAHIHTVPLRQYDIIPCAGCRACACPPHACALASAGNGSDGAEELFAMLHNASAIFLAAPIYFYALPAHFKALIDRSQRFWAAREQGSLPDETTRNTPVVTALTAGRKRGRNLFRGAVLTISYFVRTFNATLEKPLLLRGLDEPGELLRRRALCKAIENLGRSWGAVSGQAACS
ncbi:MAG: NAD(P)H-dependent oxidoreductase [Desulfovibrio sp.]|jgi:multimeric flavodoxin WrbA|nr:NAD(P)H-dependent oxidoreductase [Desulfovibrio sp.]